MINKLKSYHKNFGLGSLIILLLISGAIAVIGVVANNIATPNDIWPRTNGTFAGYEKGGTRNSSYYPVVDYTVNGQNYRIKSQVNSQSISEVGAPKEVAYNPDNPAEAKVVADQQIQFIIRALFVISAGLAIFAIFRFIISRKRQSS